MCYTEYSTKRWREKLTLTLSYNISKGKMLLYTVWKMDGLKYGAKVIVTDEVNFDITRHYIE